MIIHLILILASLFAIYWTWKTKKLFSGIISIGMVLGIGLVLLRVETLQIPGFYVYMAFVALAFVYGLIEKGKSFVTRLTICLLAASMFTYWLWVLNHWHGNTLLIPIFALLIFVAGLLSNAKLKNEWGFMVIMVADAVAIILEKVMG